MRNLLTIEQIAKMHCGLFHCPMSQAGKLMPEIEFILQSAPCGYADHVVDAKVHMLMPGQYPCIPNWHFDFIPRDVEGQQDYSGIDLSQKMHLWVSGPPLTEFRTDRGEVNAIHPQSWVAFNQSDEHRGVASEEFTWRLLIRIAPYSLCQPAPQSAWLRKHSQVYLDAENFKW